MAKRRRGREPLTDQEKAEIIEKYRAETHSMSELAREYHSNSTTISKLLHDTPGLTIRPPGGSPFQAERQRQWSARRRAEKEARKAEDEAFKTYLPNIEAAEKARAVPPKAAQRVVAPTPYIPSQQEAIAARLNAIAARVNQPEGEPVQEPTTETTWTPAGETVEDLNAALGQIEQLVANIGSFRTEMPEGVLQWTRDDRQLTPDEVDDAVQEWYRERRNQPAPTLADLPTNTDWKPMPEDPQHAEELRRAHEAGKQQWVSGNAFGWDQCTEAMVSFIDRMLEDESGDDETLTELRKALSRGEHWYHFRRDPRPWNSQENWERR